MPLQRTAVDQVERGEKASENKESVARRSTRKRKGHVFQSALRDGGAFAKRVKRMFRALSPLLALCCAASLGLAQLPTIQSLRAVGKRPRASHFKRPS